MSPEKLSALLSGLSAMAILIAAFFQWLGTNDRPVVETNDRRQADTHEAG